MAKKSLKVKQAKHQKFNVRNYTRCNHCGRPHAVLKKFGICRLCFKNLFMKDKFLVLKKLHDRKREDSKVWQQMLLQIC